MEITYQLKKALNKYAAEHRLAGLQEAITEVRAFRLAAESYAPNLATEVIMYRCDALVDNLEARAGLLKKSIECGG